MAGARTARSSRAPGHRAGGAREEVLDLLAGQECCLSAQAIHDRLRDEERARRPRERLPRGRRAGAPRPRPPRRRRRHRLLRARRPQRRAPPPRDLRPLRAPRRLRGRRARAADRGRRSSASATPIEGHDVVLRGTCPGCAGLTDCRIAFDPRGTVLSARSRVQDHRAPPPSQPQRGHRPRRRRPRRRRAAPPQRASPPGTSLFELALDEGAAHVAGWRTTRRARTRRAAST